ncbi:MAG: hypothetical protein ACKPHW_07190 [Microcystis panniformis]
MTEKEYIDSITRIELNQFEKDLGERVCTCHSLYAITKEYLKIKEGAEVEKLSPVSRYHSALQKAINNPLESKLITVFLLIKAMGGSLKIEWGELPDTLKTRESVRPVEMRVRDLEARNLELENKLIQLMDYIQSTKN